MSYCKEVVLRIDVVNVHLDVWQAASDGLLYELALLLCSLILQVVCRTTSK